MGGGGRGLGAGAEGQGGRGGREGRAERLSARPPHREDVSDLNCSCRHMWVEGRHSVLERITWGIYNRVFLYYSRYRTLDAPRGSVFPNRTLNIPSHRHYVAPAEVSFRVIEVQLGPKYLNWAESGVL